MWLAAIILSAPISSFYLGGLILKREKKIPLIMLIGSVILGVLTLIPILGWLITLLAIWLGTGSLIIFVKQSYKKPKYII
jgi:preprotein translocase subunit SecY